MGIAINTRRALQRLESMATTKTAFLSPDCHAFGSACTMYCTHCMTYCVHCQSGPARMSKPDLLRRAMAAASHIDAVKCPNIILHESNQYFAGQPLFEELCGGGIDASCSELWCSNSACSLQSQSSRSHIAAPSEANQTQRRQFITL